MKITLARLICLSVLALLLPLSGCSDDSTDPSIDSALPDQGQKDSALADTSGQKDGAKPDSARPDQASPDQATPDQGAPDQATPDQATPDQAVPDMAQGDKGLTKPDLAAGQCWTNATCGSGFFCKFPLGDCGNTLPGTCAKQPGGICPMIYKPVCGCDGKSYNNDCLAFTTGTSVRYNGKCKAP